MEESIKWTCNGEETHVVADCGREEPHEAHVTCRGGYSDQWGWLTSECPGKEKKMVSISLTEGEYGDLYDILMTAALPNWLSVKRQKLLNKLPDPCSHESLGWRFEGAHCRVEEGSGTLEEARNAFHAVAESLDTEFVGGAAYCRKCRTYVEVDPASKEGD